MNKHGRDTLNSLIDRLRDIESEITSLKDDEQDKYDRMPESFQNGEKGNRLEAIISYLEDAESAVQEAIDNIENAVSE